MPGMDKWKRLASLLKAAKKGAKGNPALSKIIAAAEIIVKELKEKERKEAAARVAPNARRTIVKVKSLPGQKQEGSQTAR